MTYCTDDLLHRRPTALMTYTHGNSVGNLCFVWKVNSSDESSFSDCQSVIERVKESIPTYHTRAMRREMIWLLDFCEASYHADLSLTGELLCVLWCGVVPPGHLQYIISALEWLQLTFLSKFLCTLYSIPLFCIGDASAASQLSEQEVDERVRLFVEMEDLEIVLDLRSPHSGQKGKYDGFWEELEKFLHEDVGLETEERRKETIRNHSYG